MKTRGWAVALTLLLSLVIPGVGATDGSEKHGRAKANLVKTLRASFIGYRYSAPPGYVPDAYCASGADGGAVGIHFVNGALIDNVLNAAEPEVLYYEPLPGGKIRLVGAEYAYFELPFGTPPVTPQHLEGHLLYYMVAPNRFGIGVDWLRLNVWAWKLNPNGTFAGDNPNVSCDAYDPNLHPQP
jgi:hypothetical protein